MNLIETPGNVKCPEVVEEVLAGKRTEANAAWWGFDETDATEALQAAIHSGARRVIVPNLTKDWIVRPIQLASDQELVFEEGTVVTARRGEFHGGGDCLFLAANVNNLTIRGYGATIRMQKQDYMHHGVYDKAEWRHTLSLRGCENVTVVGLTMKDSGGDGIYIAGGGEQRYCRNIHIKDVFCDNHYRQGISVISAVGLLVENSIFKNTWGTNPSAGIDIEPNRPQERLVNCTIRNCVFQDNYGPGILVVLNYNAPEAEDISIRFENCRVISKKGSGIVVGGVKTDGPNGLIEIKDCVTENTEKEGLRIFDKSADRALIRFKNCTWRGVGKGLGKNESLRYANIDTPAPLLIHLRRPEFTQKHGGVEFIDCLLEDDKNRAFLAAREKESDLGIYDITGTITVRNPHGASMDLGAKTHNVNLKVIEQ